MISQLESEKQNLQSSLLFMQQEHSNTLRALHEEIAGLQKKCRELTFELTMRDASGSQTSLEDKDERIKELERELNEKESQNKNLEDELISKITDMKDLKTQLKKGEKRFMEELKGKDQQILTLKVELNNKGSTIAYLTTEMHRFKVAEKLEAVPSPPSSSHGTRRKPKRLSSASDIESRPVTAKTKSTVSDAEVFLTRAVIATTDVDQEAMNIKPTPPVLPPIIDGEARKSHSRRQKLLQRRLDIKSGTDYTKLAVDKLAANTNTWVHEPKATK
ncbi:CCDC92 [Bugula neritina]|uniref:CCDC92 n=1 Tax=Bugula neritina TaxID=10212 RepID=A0A7J7IWI5_BUGNE|nr:CCDC92 [Bugula neritina]